MKFRMADSQPCAKCISRLWNLSVDGSVIYLMYQVLHRSNEFRRRQPPPGFRRKAWKGSSDPTSPRREASLFNLPGLRARHFSFGLGVDPPPLPRANPGLTIMI